MRLQFKLFLLDRKWVGPLGFALVRVDAGVGSLLLGTSFEGFCCLLHCLRGLLMSPRLPDLALGLQAQDDIWCTGRSLQQHKSEGLPRARQHSMSRAACRLTDCSFRA